MLLIFGVIHTPVLPSPTPAMCTWQSQSFAGSIPCHEAVTTSLSSRRFGIGPARHGSKTPSSREKLHPPAMPRVPIPRARRNSRRFIIQTFVEERPTGAMDFQDMTLLKLKALFKRTHRLSRAFFRSRSLVGPLRVSTSSAGHIFALDRLATDPTAPQFSADRIQLPLPRR